MKKEVEFSNLDKVYFPKEKFTKGDLVEYYRKISKVILPYLKDRPENLNRHPNGIHGDNFYQKDVDHQGPEWLKTVGVHSESTSKTIRYLLCNDEASLLYMANLGCIEINPWHSRVSRPSHPDYCLIDLDPGSKDFDVVVEVALVVHEVLEKIAAKSYVKTTGKRGMHILIPLGGKYNYEQSRDFAHAVVRLANEKLPKTTTLERSLKNRKGRLYLDYLQNAKGQTMAVTYCMRPVEGLQVSTPLEWSEVKTGISPADYTINNIFKRLESKGDLLKGLLGHGVDLEKCLKKLK